MPKHKRNRGSQRNATAEAVAAAPLPRPGLQLPWGLALVVVAVLLAYQPALQGGLVWDDDAHITRPELRSLGGLYRIWFEPGATQQYYPLLHSAFWLEHKLWGDSVVGYHLVNVLWHALAAALVYLILVRLKISGALLAAAIFALHPVAVESVAWITEQKNTLSAVFYLSAMLVYFRFDESRERSHYLLALGLFVLGLLTKTVTATLPAALLVIFWWQRGRLSWRRDVRPTVPFFLLGAVAGLTTAWVERKLIGAEGAEFELSSIQRGLLAGRVIWFYLSTLVWPTNLIFIYPRWNIDPAQWWQWLFPIATIAVTVACWALRKRWRAPLAAWLFFCGTLFPALGFLNVYPFRYSFVADHFQYLASLGVIVLVAAGISLAIERLAARKHLAADFVPWALVGGLGLLSWQQSKMYGDLPILFQTTIDRNPTCWMAYTNLGAYLTKTNQVEKAIPYLEQALRLNSGDTYSHYDLAIALTMAGRCEKAVKSYQDALQLRPDFPRAHHDMGVALAQLGARARAIEEFQIAIRQRPDFAQAQFDLGSELAKAGQSQQAIEHYRLALQQFPDYAEVHNNLGAELAKLGKFDEALEHYRKALRLNPQNAEVHNNLGVALNKMGRREEAIEHYERALELQTNYAEAHGNLGIALAAAGQSQSAVEHFQKALSITADYPETHYNLAVLLAKTGRTDEAIGHYQEAVRLRPDYIQGYANLAALYAQTDRIAEAVTAAEKALELARSAKQVAAAEQIANMLANYRARLSGSDGTSATPEGVPSINLPSSVMRPVKSN